MEYLQVIKHQPSVVDAPRREDGGVSGRAAVSIPKALAVLKQSFIERGLLT